MGRDAVTICSRGSVRMARVFMSFRPLPPACRPCHVTRHNGMTLWMIHPGTLKLDVVAWGVDHLTREEQNIIRAAYGQAPVDQSVTRSCLEGIVTHEVPRSLRLTGGLQYQPLLPRESEAG